MDRKDFYAGAQRVLVQILARINSIASRPFGQDQVQTKFFAAGQPFILCFLSSVRFLLNPQSAL